MKECHCGYAGCTKDNDSFREGVEAAAKYLDTAFEMTDHSAASHFAYRIRCQFTPRPASPDTTGGTARADEVAICAKCTLPGERVRGCKSGGALEPCARCSDLTAGRLGGGTAPGGAA